MVPQVSGASQGLGQSSPSTCGRSALRPAWALLGAEVLVVVEGGEGVAGGLRAEARHPLQGVRGVATIVPTSNRVNPKSTCRGVRHGISVT